MILAKVIINNLAAEKLFLRSAHGESEISVLNPEIQVEGNFQFGPVRLTLPENFSGGFNLFSKMAPINIPDEFQVDKSDHPDRNRMFPPMPELEKKITGRMGAGNGMIRINAEFSPVEIFLQ